MSIVPKKSANQSLDNASKIEQSPKIPTTKQPTASTSCSSIQNQISYSVPAGWVEEKNKETPSPSPGEKAYATTDYAESEHPIGPGIDSGALLTFGCGFRTVAGSVLEDYKQPKFGGVATQFKIDKVDAVRWYTSYEDSCYSQAVAYKDKIEYDFVVSYSCDASSQPKYEPYLTAFLNTVKFK